VPMNPMVDGWMGDDWFHNGAFRQQNMPYIYEQEATQDNKAKWWFSHFDDYDEFMQAASAGELGRRHGLEQVGFWRKILEHPSYDAFWRAQAMDQILAAQPLKVPVMLVDSLWDQEDIYGAIAVYKALKPKDTGNDKVFLVMGPWHHGQEIDDGSSLGALKFNSDTARHFRREILGPFLAQYLKDGAPKADVPPVSAFETGTNVWRRLPAWPAGCVSGCSVRPTPLYLSAGLKLSFVSPKPGDVTKTRRRHLRRIRFRPGQARAFPSPPHAARRLRHREGPDLALMACGRSARSLRPPRCCGVCFRGLERASENQRATRRQSVRLHHWHGLRLGGQAD